MAYKETVVFNVSGNSTQASSTRTIMDNITLHAAGNISIGLSEGKLLFSGGGGGGGSVNLSAGTTSQNLTNFVFSNSNGVSFGLNGSTVTATVATNYQSQGAYLTTAALSNHSHNFATTTTNGASIIVATTNSNGATIAVPSFLTTAALSNHSHNLATTTTNGSLIVVATTNSAGATFAVPPYLTTAQAPGAYLTTARASNDGVGLNTAQTNVTWTVNSSGISINASGYAGIGTSATNASITLNSNGLAISVAAPGGGGAVNFSAGTTSQNLQSVVFGDANNMTFGLGTGASSQSITASFNPINIGMSTNGNTAGTTGTFDGAGLQYVFAGGNNVTLSQSSNGASVTLSIAAAGGGGAQTNSTYIPYYPASTGVQTLGAQGVTSASAWFFPISVIAPVQFNRIEQLMTASWISTTVAASNTITHQFGLFTNNAGTLSLISSSSYSVANSASSISATLSYPSAYGTAGGYTYTTVGASSTATAQSLFGTAGNRVMTFGFGNTMELSAGLYWLGIHQRQSSAGAAAGMAFALAGNVMGAAASVGALGSSTAAYTGTANTLIRVPWGVATSTGSAGYGGSQLPSAVNITAMGMTVTNMPMMTFISR